MLVSALSIHEGGFGEQSCPIEGSTEHPLPAGLRVGRAGSPWRGTGAQHRRCRAGPPEGPGVAHGAGQHIPGGTEGANAAGCRHCPG